MIDARKGRKNLVVQITRILGREEQKENPLKFDESSESYNQNSINCGLS